MNDTENATRFAIRLGGACKWKLVIPGLDPDKNFFVIKPPSNTAVKMRIAQAGLSIQPNQGQEATARVDVFDQFMARVEAQVVDFRLQYTDERGGKETEGEWQFSKNPVRNREVMEQLPPDLITLLQSAMLSVSDELDQLSDEAREDWEALGNEHGGLLTQLGLAKV